MRHASMTMKSNDHVRGVSVLNNAHRGGLTVGCAHRPADANATRNMDDGQATFSACPPYVRRTDPRMNITFD